MSFTLITYSETEFKESALDNIEDSFPYLDSGDGTITWLEIEPIQEEALKKLGDHLGIHPLILENIASCEQRSKVQNLDKLIFITLKNYNFEDKDDRLEPEQIKILLGSNYLISFCEKKSAIIDKIKEEIRTGAGRTRRMGADYLAYKIIDSVIDNYYTISEKIEAQMDKVSEELLGPRQIKNPEKIKILAHNIVTIIRSILPLKDLVSAMGRIKSELIDDSLSIYLGDAQDNTLMIQEMIGSNNEIFTKMIDIYSTSLSNKTNDVMQTLTIIATIFIPLTFIVGIYGMNFQIPELNWSYGYYAIMIFMLLVALSLLYYFRKKRWL
ncbi:MAG: magnesium/cobalt transporter CorA [Deltaproteobacteria bacterium]|nr:magnesium/cobalt transporter CorA [Deltaproteobacteria bacterium]